MGPGPGGKSRGRPARRNFLLFRELGCRRIVANSFRAALKAQGLLLGEEEEERGWTYLCRSSGLGRPRPLPYSRGQHPPPSPSCCRPQAQGAHCPAHSGDRGPIDAKPSATPAIILNHHIRKFSNWVRILKFREILWNLKKKTDLYEAIELPFGPLAGDVGRGGVETPLALVRGDLLEVGLIAWVCVR